MRSAPLARTIAPLVQEQHALALVGGEEDDPAGFERPSHLIPRGLVHLKTVSRLKALEGGQRYSGLVSERLLCPTQQRACGP